MRCARAWMLRWAALVGATAALTTAGLITLGFSSAPDAEVGGGVRIMAVGDSITEGADGEHTYRYFLWELLQERGYDVDFVGTRDGVAGGDPAVDQFDQAHQARGDATVAEIAAELATGRVAEERPDVALVHVGTNDIWGDFDAEATAESMREVIGALRSANPTVTVLVAQILPCDAQTFGLDCMNNPAALNAMIPSIAAQETREESPVLLVDQWTGIDLASDLRDGMHPSELGERKMANHWYAVLAPVLDGLQ